MDLKVRKYLLDILEAALDIQAFVATLSLDEYIADGMVKAAVERKFEIIGEALNRMKRTNLEIVEVIRDYQKIIAFRNILAHGYDIVSDPIVWDIVEVNVPMLIEDIEDLQSNSDWSDLV